MLVRCTVRIQLASFNVPNLANDCNTNSNWIVLLSGIETPNIQFHWFNQTYKSEKKCAVHSNKYSKFDVRSEFFFHLFMTKILIIYGFLLLAFLKLRFFNFIFSLTIFSFAIYNFSEMKLNFQSTFFDMLKKIKFKISNILSL